LAASSQPSVHADGDNISIKPEHGTSPAYTLDRLERDAMSNL
jgi:hypothetical protein